MRILIVNVFYYPDMVGGTEHSVKLLAEGLARKGHEVAIFCYGKINKLCKNNIQGVMVYRSHCGNYKPIIFNNLSLFQKFRSKILEIDNPKVLSDFYLTVKEFNPDIIHVNNLYGISTSIWNFSNNNGIPVVHTLRDYRLLSPIRQLPHISAYLAKRRSLYVGAVTAPSKVTLDKFIKSGFFKNSIKKVIPNAIDIDINELKEIILKRREKVDKKIRFLFVGVLSRYKGVDMLLDVFSSIEIDTIELYICGQGDLLYRILEMEKYDKRIKYMGQLDKNQLREVYLFADVLIVPSIWEEPFGRVVIEGNQYGLPVIGSNRGGIKEIIDNIGTGVLYQYDSKDQLKEMMIQFSNRRYIQSFFDKIEKNILFYSLEYQLDAFLRLYKLTIQQS